jgi:putative SOS response-associated peptidase YedK
MPAPPASSATATQSNLKVRRAARWGARTEAAGSALRFRTTRHLPRPEGTGNVSPDQGRGDQPAGSLNFVCGRFTSTSSVEDLVAAFDVDVVRTEPLPFRWNVAPTQQIYAVATRRTPGEGEGKGIRALGTFRWGLVPSWAKDLASGAKMINARAEGIAERPAFRQALVKRRCVIPVDAFYEWQARPGQKAKLPWAVRRTDGRPMAMAGLWEVWWDREAPGGTDPVRTCTIVTTRANDALSDIHQRMPVVLGSDAVNRWLDPTLQDRAELQALLAPAASDLLAAHPVSTLVNKVSVDGPELLEPLTEPPGGPA